MLATRSIPIAVKIIGVAALLLIVMGSVAIYSYFRIVTVKNETVDLSEFLIPLTNAIARIDTILMQLEIHRERLIEFQGAARNEDRVQAELKRFPTLANALQQEILSSRQLLTESIKKAKVESDKIEMARLEPMLAFVDKQHHKLNGEFLKILNRREQGQRAEAQALLERVREEEDELNKDVAEIATEIERFSNRASMQVERDELGMVRLAGENLMVTIGAGLLGLVLGAVLTAGLVRPVRRLMSGALAVEHGNLDVELPVTSRDEIGMLSRSFNSMVHELRVKERIKETFGRYLDPRIVENLIRQTDITQTAGEKQVMTVFFSDLAGFTSIGEMLTPDGLVRLINRYFTLASEPIIRYRGVIDKYIGDAIMAFWGPPFTSDQEHAKLGCLAALEQSLKLEELRRLLPEIVGIKRGLPSLNVRIGLCTGVSIVGNVGSDVSRSFTVMGETVNIASRLEGANKQYGTQVLISEETEKMASDTVECREIDFVRVAGKTEPVRIFELLARKGGLEPVTDNLRAAFTEGLCAYRNRRWNDAQAKFQACLKMKPADGPSELFLKRLEHLKQNPPEDTWDGVWTLTHK